MGKLNRRVHTVTIIPTDDSSLFMGMGGMVDSQTATVELRVTTSELIRRRTTTATSRCSQVI